MLLCLFYKMATEQPQQPPQLPPELKNGFYLSCCCAHCDFVVVDVSDAKYPINDHWVDYKVFPTKVAWVYSFVISIGCIILVVPVVEADIESKVANCFSFVCCILTNKK